MTQRYYCTLFNAAYALKGLTMIRSLEAQGEDFTLFVLALDAKTKSLIESFEFKSVRVIELNDIEDDDLIRVKGSRSVAEYCWTLTSCLMVYVIAKYEYIDMLTYLDADIFFFSSPKPVFEELRGKSIGAIAHRYPKIFQDRLAYGKYNVQWVTIRRDEEGIKCLKWWRDRCIEWCFNRLEKGRMGDQKYLDLWPELFAGFHEIENIGAGVAPWNYCNYCFGAEGDRLLVNGVPIVFYHFHQFRILDGERTYWFSSAYKIKGYEPPRALYEIYTLALRDTLRRVRQVFPRFNDGIEQPRKVMLLALARKVLPLGLKNWIKKHGIAGA